MAGGFWQGDFRGNEVKAGGYLHNYSNAGEIVGGVWVDGSWVSRGGPVVDPRSFGANPYGEANATAALQEALTYAESVGGVVELPANAVFSVGRVLSAVPIISHGATLRRASYGGNSERAVLVLQAGAAIHGHLVVDGNSDNVTGIGATDASYAVEVTGDRVSIESLETFGFGTGIAYDLQITDADFFRLGRLDSTAPSYAAMRLSSTTGKLHLIEVGTLISRNSRFKGFVYNGLGGIETMWFGRVWAVTDTTEAASNGLQIDSGDADPAVTDTTTTIRIDRLSVGELHCVGHHSDGAKVQHTARAEFGRIYCAPVTDLSSRAGLRAWAPDVTIGTIETTERVIAYGDIRIDTLRYLGAGDRALECNGMLGNSAWIGRLEIGDSTISAAPIRVSRGTARSVHLESYDSTSQVPVSFTSPVPDNQISISVGAGVLMPHTATGVTGNANERRVHRPPRQVRQAAAPSDGTWARADICWNTTPSASGYVGWVCVTAGSPGTWRGFGLIEADP